MVKIEEVAEGTYRWETRLPGARYTFAAYLLTGEEGVLIEPGPAVMAPFIREAMEQVGIRELSCIIPTHIHLDHGGGAGKLAELFPQTVVVLHPRGERHALDPSRLIAGTKMAYGDDFESTYGPILPVPKSQVKVPEDGETIRVEGRELQVFYAPGHAPHQLAILDRSTGGLFCGEALGLPVPGDRDVAVPSVSAQDFDLDSYLETVEKLEKLKPRMLFYSHEGGVREPGRLISSLVENVTLLGDLILKGLRSGETTESIERRVRDLLATRVGPVASAVDPETITLGFALFFRKKGLVDAAPG